MTKEEMNAIAKEIDILSMEICDEFDDCIACPLRAKYVSVRTDNEHFFSGGCMPLLLERVFKINTKEV